MSQPIISTNASGGNGSSGNSLSFNITIPDGVARIVAAFCSEWFSNPSNPYTGVTFNGVAMTMVRQDSGGGSHHIWTEVWEIYLATPLAAGTYTIAASGITPNANARVGVAQALFSTKMVAAEVSASSAGSGTEPLTTSITTIANFALVLAAYGSQNGGAVTPGGSQTDLIQTGTPSGEDMRVDLSYEIVNPAQTVTLSALLSNPEGENLILISIPLQEVPPGSMI